MQDFSSLLTPLIAITAAYIAYQQWRTNKDKLKMDLYERRFKVFTFTREFLLYSLEGEGRDSKKMRQFDALIVESHFLFNDEIPTFLCMVWEKAKELDICRENLNSKEIDEKSEFEEKEVMLVYDIGQLLRESRVKFGEYLSVSDI